MNKENFLKIMPENLKKYKNLQGAAHSFVTSLTDDVIPEIQKLNIYSEMELLSESTLDELAWQWNVEFYISGLPKSKKIELIKNSYIHHRKKGTVGVLESALKTLVGDIEISEFDKYSGTPFTFRIISAENVPKNGDLTEMKKMIETFKNTRSTLDKILFIKEDRGKIGTFATQHIAGRTINYPRKED